MSIKEPYWSNVPLYQSAQPFARHAGCGIMWKMQPHVIIENGVLTDMFLLPEPHAFEDWPLWAQEAHNAG